MVKTIVIVAVVVLGVPLAGILAFAATKPDTFIVQRATTIKASPKKIFPLVNDFRNFAAWSPYEKIDPSMKRIHSGAANGKGAIYEWDSDGKAGAGRLEITEAAPPSKVAMTLDFFKPFETHNIVEFILVPQGDSTNVTWAMRGPTPYIAKVMHVLFDMDGMVGKDFEAGLANLKTMTEN